MLHTKDRAAEMLSGVICIDIYALCSATPRRPRAAKSWTVPPLGCPAVWSMMHAVDRECLMES